MSTKFYNLKQEISSSPQIDEAVSEKAIKEYVDKTGLQLINPTTTAGSSSSPYLAVKWQVSDVAGVTTVSDGMRVLARVNAVGVSSGGLLLSIDGGTTYHPVVYAASTIPTTTYMAVGTTVLLIYNADATATCYGTSGTSTSYTGCWQLDYHFTLYMYRLLHNNGTYVTKTDLKRYKLMVQYDETTMLPISSGSSTSSHTIDTTNAFMPFGQICYCTSSTTNYKSAGAAIGASVLANMYALDMRYTFNGGTSMLTTNKDVYLVANPQSDGKAKIDSSPLAQELPSTEDNKIYIYLGHAYSAYQIELHPVHPIYWYKNGAIRIWDNADLTDADIKVKQDKDVTTNGALPLLMSPKPLDSSFTTQTETSSLVPNIYVNPSTETLYAPRFSGNGANLTGVPVSSHTHGNIANGGTLTDTAAAPANGDKIVIRDVSDNKVQSSNIAFDGSTTNKYLSPKGTWENVPTNTDTKLYIKNGALADWTATEGGISVTKMLSLAAIDDGSTFDTSGADGAYTGLRVPIVAGTLSTSSLDVLVFGQIAPMTGKNTLATGDMLVIANAAHGGEMMYSSSLAIDTTNTTQYLRADGTWATPAGGGGGDTGYTSSTLSDNTSTITFGSTKEYQVVAVTGSTQTFNIAVNNRCTNYLLVTNGGSSDCAVAIGVQSGTLFTSVVKPSAGITVGVGKAVELSFISIAGGTILVVTVSAEMEVDSLS